MYNEMTTIETIHNNGDISLRAYYAIIRASKRSFYNLQSVGLIPEEIEFDFSKVTYGMARLLNYSMLPNCGVRTKKELVEFLHIWE